MGRVNIPSRRLLPLAAGTGVVVVVFLLSLLTFMGARRGNLDDLFILLVYVRHFIESGSFYWNLQDGRVDGFTSVLDLLIKTASARLFFADLVTAAFFATLAFHVGCGLVAAYAASLLGRGQGRWAPLAYAAIGGVAVASSTALAEGSYFLLESPLFTCVTLGALVAHLRLQLVPPPSLSWPRLSALALLWILLPLARPEGLVLSLALAGIFFFGQGRSLSFGRRLYPCLGCGLVLGAYLVWHRVYFGHWQPNTYFAKTSDSRWSEIRDGAAYVLAARESVPGAAQLIMAAVGGLLLAAPWRDPLIRRAYLSLWGLWLLSLSVVVFAGGDCYAGMRFLTAPFAIGTLAVLVALAGLRGPARYAPLCALALMVLPQVADVIEQIGPQVAAIRGWPLRSAGFSCNRQIVQAIASALPPGASVAETDFQLFKYFSDQTRVIDLHGLNDRRIAHESRSGRVTYGKFTAENGVRASAEVWIWGAMPLKQRPMSDYPMRALAYDRELAASFTGYVAVPEAAEGPVADALYQLYLPATFPVCGFSFNFLVRKDVARRFDGTLVRVGLSAEASHPAAR